MISDIELIQIIFALGDDAYTGSITRAVSAKTGQHVQVGWLHMRINRLKALGLLLQEKNNRLPNGARSKSFVKLTLKGQEIGRLQGEPGRATASLRRAME
ncbi:MAG TPA: hypothetical protein VHX61_01010 [Rhizomicrobium sp.]|jgi:hypothetical protein|nr:hypothetical protein [Rhizomicrobium sp.]